MRLRKIIERDDAVSPVIGVVLMVAITVVLVTVAASFVLGIGDNTGEVAPTATFTFEYDGDIGDPDEGILTITHGGGEAIRPDELFVRGDGIGGCGMCTTTIDITSPGDWPSDLVSSEADGVSAVGTEDAVNVGVYSDYDVSVVWDARDSSESSVLDRDDGPDA